MERRDESEDDFVAKSRWYKNWGYHWHYYRDIFLFARAERHQDVRASTRPREVVSAVRKKGFQNLTPEEASRIPPKIDTDNEDHKTLFRAFFAGEESMMHTMSAQMFDGMFAAQCTWDASMGYNAVQNLKKFGGPEGHHGGAHRLRPRGLQPRRPAPGRAVVRRQDGVDRPGRRSPTPRASRRPASRRPTPTTSGACRRRAIRSTRRSACRPRDGKGEFPLEVIDVPKDSVAGRAGFQVGDVLQTMDGTPLKDRETLNRLLAEKRWADAAVFTVSRGGAAATVTAVFRRQPPPAK